MPELDDIHALKLTLDDIQKNLDELATNELISFFEALNATEIVKRLKTDGTPTSIILSPDIKEIVDNRFDHICKVFTHHLAPPNTFFVSWCQSFEDLYTPPLNIRNK